MNTPVGHSVATMVRARELWEVGEGLAAITRTLHAELGVTVHPTTVRYWCDPEFAQRKLAQQRAGRKVGRLPRRLLDRMVTLRTAGLSYAAVAIVLNLDEGTDRFDAVSVRYYLGRYARLDSPWVSAPGQLSADNTANLPARGRAALVGAGG